LWLDAADASTITLNGSTVSQWADKSGNARNATQPTAASQPTYTSNGLGAKPALLFDGVKGMMSSLTAAPAIETIFVVYKVVYYPTNCTLLGASAQTGRQFRDLATTLQLLAQANYFIAQSVTLPTPVYQEVISGLAYNPTSVQFFVNGVADPLQTVSTITYLDTTTTIGYSGSSGGEGMIGYMSEIVVANTLLSTTDRQKLEGYLAWKWGGV
jgi:hypothetical protein